MSSEKGVSGGTHHDDKRKAVVENKAKRMLKPVEPAEVGGLHDGIRHGLDNEGNVTRNLVVGIVEANERLQEANDNDKEQRKEDDALLHHDLQNHQHGPKEAVAVQVEEEPDPKHGGTDGQEIVAQRV